jgi:hypothetical protein
VSPGEQDERWLRRRASLLADLARHDARRAVRARWITRTALLAAVERAGRGRR